MTIQEFINDCKEKKVMNNKINDHAVSDYLKANLDIKTYIPFRTKREIAETVVKANITEIDGVKHHDSIDGYVSFVVAMISTHTSLQFSDDPVADYDLLAESGLLPQIIAEFKESYDECDIILKMVLEMELEDNNINIIVGKFLNGVLSKLDNAGDVLKDTLGNININDIFGGKFKPDDLEKLTGFLNKYNN